MGFSIIGRLQYLYTSKRKYGYISSESDGGKSSGFNRNHSKMDAYTFAEGYLRLSYGARKHIQDKVTGLAEREDAFYMFPWDYEKAARADL